MKTSDCFLLSVTMTLAGCSSPTNDRATEGTPAGSTATSGTTGTSGMGGASGTGSSTTTSTGGTQVGTGGTQAGAGGAQAGAGGAQAGTGGSAGPFPDDAGGGGTAEADGSTATTVPGAGTCVMPAGAKFMDAATAYAKWKVDLITTSGAGGFVRVTRPNSPGNAVNSTASEGIGYGMLIAVYMDEQDVFDKLWKYEQLHLNARGLMDWQINPEGTAPSGTGAATDGDEDMAFALIMADKKWGGAGSLADTYLNNAKKLIDLIWQYEVDHALGDVLMPGDQFGGGQIINISYFAPAYYRQFGKVTGKTAEWTRVVDSSYRVLAATLNAANKNASNGLVPAWSTPDGVPKAPAGQTQIHHQLDSCRTPFRIAQDYCWFGEPRALTYLQKISSFYAGVGAANIVEGYNLDGSPYDGASLHLASFVGPAGVGAMAANSYAPLRNQAYTALVTPPGLLGGSIYYSESWTVLSLLMMSGRFSPP